MTKIGLFYADEEEINNQVANKILREFGIGKKEVMQINEAWNENFKSYDCFLLCIKIWFDGELPTYWDEFLPELHTLNLKGKKIGIIGIGDHFDYSGKSSNGIHLLSDILKKDGATLIDYPSAKKDGAKDNSNSGDTKYNGLVIDINDNTSATDKRIREWCKYVKTEFESEK